jgi:hypothetical protein
VLGSILCCETDYPGGGFRGFTTSLAQVTATLGILSRLSSPRPPVLSRFFLLYVSLSLSILSPVSLSYLFSLSMLLSFAQFSVFRHEVDEIRSLLGLEAIQEILDLLTLEDGTDSLSRNVGKELPPYAA